jgi:hypothetical protein
MAAVGIDALLGERLPRRSKSRTKAQAREQLVELDGQLAAQLSKADLDALVDATARLVDAGREDEEAERPVSPVTGRPASTRREILAAYRENLVRGFALRRELLSECLSVREVADLLDTTRQTPHDRAGAGRLLALKDRGQLYFPAWQFDPQASDGIVDGLPRVLAELAMESPLARAMWFATPKPQLQGRAPADALRQGHVDAVVGEARAAHSG